MYKWGPSIWGNDKWGVDKSGLPMWVFWVSCILMLGKVIDPGSIFLYGKELDEEWKVILYEKSSSFNVTSLEI